MQMPGANPHGGPDMYGPLENWLRKSICKEGPRYVRQTKSCERTEACMDDELDPKASEDEKKDLTWWFLFKSSLEYV